MRWASQLDRQLARCESALLAILLVAMIGLAAAQVLLRLVWAQGIEWADALLQHLTVMIGLVGAAVATSEARHLNIDALGRLAKGPARFGLEVVIDLSGLVVSSLLARGGWTAFRSLLAPWRENLPRGWSVSHALRGELADGLFPPWLTQLMLPLGFGLIALHFGLRLLGAPLRARTRAAGSGEGEGGRRAS